MKSTKFGARGGMLMLRGDFEMRRPRGTGGGGRPPLTASQILLIDRLRERLATLGLKPTNVSKEAGCSGTYLLEIMDGSIRSPGREKLESIAKVLKTDIAYLTGVSDTALPAHRREPDGMEAIPIVGVAEAGTFRKMSEAAVLDEAAPIAAVQAPRNPRYPRAKHFAFDVRGDSMNAATPTPILDGMQVLCVDLIDTDRPIESGGIYVVRRTLDAGQTYEFTIKRAEVYRDRIELVPQSTNPKHEKFVLKNESDVDHAIEITAIGKVYFIGSWLD